MLVDELIATARASGAARIVLETQSSWSDVIAFYAACGFRHTHFAIGEFGEDAWFEMELDAHRTRLISTKLGAGQVWQAWCETEGCGWKGRSFRGGLGGRQEAEREAAAHAEAKLPKSESRQ